MDIFVNKPDVIQITRTEETKTAKPLNVGMIGCGFMGRTHSNAYRKVNNFFALDHHPVLKVVCARNAKKAQAFADTWGYESIETDWRQLVERADIDLIDIGSPNNSGRRSTEIKQQTIAKRSGF